MLKPQDVVVALKLLGYAGSRPPFAQIASDLVMSPSEVHAAVKRAQAAHLLHVPELFNRPNISALEVSVARQLDQSDSLGAFRIGGINDADGCRMAMIGIVGNRAYQPRMDCAKTPGSHPRLRLCEKSGEHPNFSEVLRAGPGSGSN